MTLCDGVIHKQGLNGLRAAAGLYRDVIVCLWVPSTDEVLLILLGLLSLSSALWLKQMLQYTDLLMRNSVLSLSLCTWPNNSIPFLFPASCGLQTGGGVLSNFLTPFICFGSGATVSPFISQESSVTTPRRSAISEIYHSIVINHFEMALISQSVRVHVEPVAGCNVDARMRSKARLVKSDGWVKCQDTGWVKGKTWDFNWVLPLKLQKSLLVMLSGVPFHCTKRFFRILEKIKSGYFKVPLFCHF